MSKIGCICDNTISDNSDQIPYKASFIRNENYSVYDNALKKICEYIDAIKNNKGEEWLKDYGFQDADNMSDFFILVHILTDFVNEYEGLIYQCEKCGRVLIQSKDDKFVYFYPEEGNFKDIFKGLIKNKRHLTQL